VSKTGGAPKEVESDNEDQDPGEETSMGTADTADRTKIGSAGQMHFGPEKCLVRLTTKVQTHTILCGHLKDSCRRPKHQALQLDPFRVGRPGVYNATLNSGGLVLDAIEDSFITEKEHDQLHQENRRRPEQMAGSTQKQRAEEALRERSPPQVQFDLDQPEGLNNPASTLPAEESPLRSRREQLREWIESVSPESPDPTPPTTGPGNSPRCRDASLQGMEEPSVAVLLATLVSELKGLKGGLAAQQEALTDFIAETNAEHTRDRAKTTQSTGASKKATALLVVVVDDEDTVVEPTLKAKKNRKCYAVAKGHSTGVFHSWRAVTKAIKDYPGAIHKRFRSEVTAQAWLDDQRDPKDSDRRGPRDQDSRSGDTWNTRVEGLEDIPEEVVCEPTLQDVRRTSLPIDQIVNLSTIGPDLSTGKAKEIYGRSLQVEP
jgi:hypothetical protein